MSGTIQKYTSGEFSGTPPFTFKSDGENLRDWSMSGQSTQASTPSPSAPVNVEGVGTLSGNNYVIPISCGNTTTNIYLNSAVGTRRVKKWVLTGEEPFLSLAEGLYRVIVNGYLRELDIQIAICSHFGGGMTVKVVPSSKLDTVSFLVSSSGNNYVYFSPAQYLTVDDFKAYLRQQYSNGTPVTVWYVLETPETSAVNEPLMKIGDYADELTLASTGVDIPTTSGSNTLTVGTTVQPSAMSITSKAFLPTLHKKKVNGSFVYDPQTYERVNGEWVSRKWSNIKVLVNAGVHQQYFSVGDQLTCTRGNDTILWDIVDMTATDMTLLMHDCPYNLQFDSKEAMFAFENGLPAGTYHFTITNQPWYAGDVGKVIQFTLTEAIPAGGQLVVQNANNATMIGAKINSYASGSSSTVIESVTMSEGSDGTDLGSLTNAGDATNGINSVQRGFLASNRWSTSAIRQFLNSDDAAGSVWTPQTPFDRPPAWVSSQAGFKNGLEADFLSAISPNTNTTVLNTVSDGGGTETTTDMFYLPSRTEIYGTDEVSGSPEGAQYAYYIGTDNSAKIKKYNNSAVSWWLRTPTYDSTYRVRIVAASGAPSYVTADGTIRLAAACVIRADT